MPAVIGGGSITSATVASRSGSVSTAGTDTATESRTRRIGTLAGIAAYGMWGLFPLVFHQLHSVGAIEVVLHRVLWSFVVVVVLLAVQGDREFFIQSLPRGHRLFPRTADGRARTDKAIYIGRCVSAF